MFIVYVAIVLILQKSLTFSFVCYSILELAIEVYIK